MLWGRLARGLTSVGAGLLDIGPGPGQGVSEVRTVEHDAARRITLGRRPDDPGPVPPTEASRSVDSTSP